jgi:pimeloyl-ACP methyl ester carboxylesterase
MRRIPIDVPMLGPLPLHTAMTGPVGAELDAAGVGPNDPVLVLLHSFDSSSLEWRRTYPLLAGQAGGDGSTAAGAC